MDTGKGLLKSTKRFSYLILNPIFNLKKVNDATILNNVELCEFFCQNLVQYSFES